MMMQIAHYFHLHKILNMIKTFSYSKGIQYLINGWNIDQMTVHQLVHNRGVPLPQIKLIFMIFIAAI